MKVVAQNDYIIATVTEDKASVIELKETRPVMTHLVVKSVGPKVTSCKAGDKIMPAATELPSIEFEGERLIVLTDDQIVATLEGSTK